MLNGTHIWAILKAISLSLGCLIWHPTSFWGAEGSPILFSDLVFFTYKLYILYINYNNYNLCIIIYIYICQDGGAVGFVEFTKLLFALSALAQPFNRVRSIPEHFFIILSQRKACAGRFREETAGKRTESITRWPPRRLLFIRLEIVFATISPFTKRTKVVHRVFQEG